MSLGRVTCLDQTCFAQGGAWIALVIKLWPKHITPDLLNCMQRLVQLSEVAAAARTSLSSLDSSKAALTEHRLTLQVLLIHIIHTIQGGASRSCSALCYIAPMFSTCDDVPACIHPTTGQPPVRHHQPRTSSCPCHRQTERPALEGAPGCSRSDQQACRHGSGGV